MEKDTSSQSYEAVADATRLDASRSLTEDRLAEVAEYFGYSTEKMQQVYEAFNVTKVRRSPKFDDSSLSAIIGSYVDKDTLESHISRLMIRYTRLEAASKLLAAMNDAFDETERKDVEICDYGCGAADFGLAFALHGYGVTLVDLEGGKIEFAKWRFERRSLPVKTIAINENNEYPVLSDLNLVMAGDVLEHLRDPRIVVTRVHEGLRDKGYFWFPDFPFKEKSVGGDHLASAAQLRDDTAKLVRKLFKPAGVIKHLMMKAPA